MKVLSIKIGGFKNISMTKINFERISALVSLNNYGKSNIIEGLDFSIDFLTASQKQRKTMMEWTKAIPINKNLENENFYFEIEFHEKMLKNFQYVKYGYSFAWNKNKISGKIIDEWLELRDSESSKYSSFLKRKESKYRKGKNTNAFRKINLDYNQLAIDVLSSINDTDISGVIKVIKNIKYRNCSAIDSTDCFQTIPIEFLKNDSTTFEYDDIPKALYLMKKNSKERFKMFEDAISTLFPEFESISIGNYDISKKLEMNLVKLSSEKNISNEDILPFKIKDEVYKLYIKTKYLNQPLDISLMSTGTKRIFWLLANVLGAESNNISLLGIEELETSIHPRLLKNLLEILNTEIVNTSIIISSHSPFLIQYLKLPQIYLGVPNKHGIAQFMAIPEKNHKKIIANSEDSNASVGEYIFNLASGDDDSLETLKYYIGVSNEHI